MGEEQKVDVDIYSENASYLRAFCKFDSDVQSLNDFFKFKDPTFSRNPYSRWDGMVRLYDKGSSRLPVGLLFNLVQYCKDTGLTYNIDENFYPFFNEDVTLESVRGWIRGLNLSRYNDKQEAIACEAYDYQEEALYYAARFERLTLLAATAAGKSLIMYLLALYYEEIGVMEEGRFLIVVPSVSLATQMADNFYEYSRFNGWDAYGKVQTIAEGSSKVAYRPIVVSTWQAIQDEPKEYFEQFLAVAVDECHLASAKKISYIMGACVNAYNRVGMTGTLKSENIHQLQVQALFGPIKRVVSARELQDAGRAAQTMVRMVTLLYPPEDRRELDAYKKQPPVEGAPKTTAYQKEIDWLIHHPARNEFLINLARNLTGNTLMLFDRKEKHLNVIAERMLAEIPDKAIHVISGDVKGEVRTEIKRKAETSDDVIILATYGTMSTGESVKKLHNLVFCHPSKSIIRVLQSLGRLMRLHETKDLATIIDIADDARLYVSDETYAIQHAIQRLQYYRDEKHAVKPVKHHLKGRTHRLF